MARDRCLGVAKVGLLRSTFQGHMAIREAAEVYGLLAAEIKRGIRHLPWLRVPGGGSHRFPSQVAGLAARRQGQPGRPLAPASEQTINTIIFSY